MEIETVEFFVTNVVYSKGDFAVVNGRARGERTGFTVRGNLGEVHKTDLVVAQGAWKVHKVHGPQFEAVSSTVLPNNEPGFIGWAAKYLPSLGNVRAKALWNKYGPKLRDMLEAGETAPLLLIKGITPARAEEIIKVYRGKIAEATQMAPLQDFGFGYVSCESILRFFGSATGELLKKNPYRFVDAGVDFDEVDRLSRGNGWASDSWQRVNAFALRDVKADIQANGNTRTDWTKLRRAWDVAGSDLRKLGSALRQGGDLVAAGGKFVEDERTGFILPGGYCAVKKRLETDKIIAEFAGLQKTSSAPLKGLPF